MEGLESGSKKNEVGKRRREEKTKRRKKMSCWEKEQGQEVGRRSAGRGAEGGKGRRSKERWSGKRGGHASDQILQWGRERIIGRHGVNYERRGENGLRLESRLIVSAAVRFKFMLHLSASPSRGWARNLRYVVLIFLLDVHMLPSPHSVAAFVNFLCMPGLTERQINFVRNRPRKQGELLSVKTNVSILCRLLPANAKFAQPTSWWPNISVRLVLDAGSRLTESSFGEGDWVQVSEDAPVKMAKKVGVA
eukprot:596643-Hanusia_phi.AAC.1